jgi:hypothetical protein
MKLDLRAHNKMLADKIKQQEQLYTRVRATEVFRELDQETEGK